MNCQILLFFVIVTSALSSGLRRAPSDTINDDTKSIKTKSPYEHGSPTKRNTENYLRVVSVADLVPENVAKNVLITTADTLDPVYKGDEPLYRTADPRLAKQNVYILPAALESQPRNLLYPADSAPQIYQVYDPQPSPSISDTVSLARYYKHDQRLAKNKLQIIPTGLVSKPKIFYKPNSVSDRYQVGVYDPEPTITISEIPSIARIYPTPLNSYYVR